MSHDATQLPGIMSEDRHATIVDAIEEGDIEATRRIVEGVIERGVPVALCTHGPLLETVLKAVRARVTKRGKGGRAVYRVLGEAIDGNLDKGEALVAHMVGAGDKARVVAVERNRL